MTQLKVAILQHSEHTPPGNCTDWLSERGHQYQIHHLYNGEMQPEIEDFDWLIVLGGPMNVDDTSLHPWLVEEKKLIAQAIGANKICLGLCLGGQLIAQCLGGTVSKNIHWEVGWQPVELLGNVEARALKVFQWHQDHFSLPPGTVRIATNSATLNQAFIYKQNVLGIQFHPESTSEWIHFCAEDKELPPPEKFVQSADEILAQISSLEPMQAWFFDWLVKLENQALSAIEEAGTNRP